MQKIEENMWCWNCEHEWDTDDYYECKTCPNCQIEPVHIMRTSSTGYAYLWMQKNEWKLRDRKINEIINEDKTRINSNQSPNC